MGKHAIILLSIITPFWSNFVLKLRIQFVLNLKKTRFVGYQVNCDFLTILVLEWL